MLKLSKLMTDYTIIRWTFTKMEEFSRLIFSWSDEAKKCANNCSDYLDTLWTKVTQFLSHIKECYIFCLQDLMKTSHWMCLTAFLIPGQLVMILRSLKT